MRRKSDSQLRDEVLRELKWDTRLDWAEVGAEVRGGVVTLTGAVPTYAKKVAAQAAAGRVCGVLEVVNRIEVRGDGGQRLADEEVADAVRRALAWDVLVRDEDIRSSVTDGLVTLEGTVRTLRERDETERALRRLAGVAGIRNEITVAPAGVSPAELRRAIEAALERRAGREAHRLRVDVSGDEVTLSGEVRSWAERRAVLGAVGHAPGVRVVNDRLCVEPEL